MIGGVPPNLPLARELGMTPGIRSEDSGTGKAPGATVLPAELGEIKTVSRELRFLSGKVEGLMVQLNEMKALFMARQENGEEKGTVAVTQERGGEEPSEEKRAILELRKELRILSDKVDHIAGAFSQMGRVLAEVDRSSAEKKKDLKDNVEQPPAR